MKVESDADIPDNNFSNTHGHQHKHMHPTHEKYKKKSLHGILSIMKLLQHIDIHLLGSKFIT